MKIEEIIKKTKTPVTKQMIKDGLVKLGINNDTKVIVHTKLSSFGYVVNKQYDIVDSLRELITSGVCIMPAHNAESTEPEDWENPPVPDHYVKIIKENRKPYNIDDFLPERIGKVPILFDHIKESKRTLHPVFALSMINNTTDDNWLIHDLDEAKNNNPFYKLIENNGKILFLGTDFTTCTFLHICEKYDTNATIKSGKQKVLHNDNINDVTYKYFESKKDYEDAFKDIGNKYYELHKDTNDYNELMIGNAKCILIDAKKLYNIGRKYYKGL